MKYFLILDNNYVILRAYTADEAVEGSIEITEDQYLQVVDKINEGFELPDSEGELALATLKFINGMASFS